MLKLAKVLIIAAVVAAAPPAQAGAARNVILVIADGVRWQEVFEGAAPTLLDGEELRHKYWNDDPLIRRRLLFPFLWETATPAKCLPEFFHRTRQRRIPLRRVDRRGEPSRP